MYSRIVVCCWLFLSPLLVDAQLVLRDSTERVPVGLQTAVLEDKTARLTIEQVRQRTDFKPSTSDDFHFGFTNSAVWLRVNLSNQSNHQKWHIVLLDGTALDYADLYLHYPDGHLEHQLAGLKRPYPKRGYVTLAPLFPVRIPTETTVTAYVRLQSSLSMSGKMVVWEEFHNLTTGRGSLVVVWLFLGLFMLRSLNSFVLVGFIPDRQFRFYAFCSFLLYLATFSRMGIYPVIFSGQPWLIEWLTYGLNRLLPAGLAAWGFILLDNRRAFIPLRWLLAGVVGLGVGGAFLSFWVQNATISQLYSVLFLLSYPLFIGSVILAWMARLKPPLHYLLPMVFCTALLPVFQLQSLHIIPYNQTIPRLIMVVLTLEIISVSVVMGRIVQIYIRNQISAANALMKNKVEVDNLREMNQLKTRFFTNVSHEFRTPLTLLIGPLTDQIRQFPTNELYGLMYRNATRLQTLINQILDLAKAEASQLPVQLQAGDLVTDVRLWVSAFESLAESRSIRLTLTQNQTTQPAHYDADKLQKILTNLVSNALKFTPDGGQVRVEAHYDQSLAPLLHKERGWGEVFTLTVTDSGVGIAPDQLPHIFDRFYQGKANTDNSPQTDQVGTGIGLALVNELVKLLGGTISVQSVVGEGTTFTLQLPLESTAEPVASRQPVLVQPPQNGFVEPPQSSLPTVCNDNHPTILIVEDNADMRTYIRRILGPTFILLEAADGQQGLDMALEHMPDLIVTDWMMPRLDGISLCRSLRADPRTDHIPVVMLTAKAALEDRLDGLEIGADDYLVKPFLATELLIRLQNLLKRQQAMQQYFQRQLGAVAAPDLSPTPSIEKQPRTETVYPAVAGPDRELNSQQQKFLDRAYQFLLTHLDNPALDTDLLASELAMSSRTLNRKLTALTAMTAWEFIRTYRLEQAMSLLRSGLSPTETAYRVGFDNLSSFSRTFKDHFGYPPSTIRS